MTRGPYAHDFSVQPSMTPAWFASDSRAPIADVILSFQAPNGGWSKHVDFSQHARRPGESYFTESADWEWISTIDNGATTEEIRFLAARRQRRKRDERYERAILRGIDYLLASQFPNGCFPQVYPLQGSYHDAATFNDDATINVLRLLRDVGDGTYPYASAEQRKQATDAVVARHRLHSRARRCASSGKPDGVGPAARSADARADERAELRAHVALRAGERVDRRFSHEPPVAERARRACGARRRRWLEPLAIRGYSYAKYELKPAPARRRSGAGSTRSAPTA